MVNICSGCGVGFEIRKNRKTNLCDRCYKDYRREYKRHWIAKKRSIGNSILEKLDRHMRPYISQLLSLNYEVRNAIENEITFGGDTYFETLPYGWRYENDGKYAYLSSDGSKKSWVELGRWVYYDLKFKETPVYKK